jgi:hypothetical protein
VLVYQGHQDEMDLAVRIKNEISLGNTVVLKGYPFHPASLTSDGLLRSFYLPKHRPMEVSGMLFLFLMSFLLNKF